MAFLVGCGDFGARTRVRYSSENLPDNRWQCTVSNSVIMQGCGGSPWKCGERMRVNDFYFLSSDFWVGSRSGKMAVSGR